MRNENSITGAERNSSISQNYSKNQSQQTEEPSLHLRKVSEIYETLKEDILQRDGVIKYPFGLTELDEKTGGLHKKELVCIAAETSHGKSAFSINLLRNLADKGVKIAYFSLEMSSEQIVERLLTNICEIDNQDLRFGRALNKVEERESVFKDWIESTNLLIDDRYGFEYNNIERIVTELEPDFLFIDYIQLASTRGKSKTESIENYIRGVKQLCNIHDLGAVVISQLNRDEKSSLLHRMKWAAVLAEAPDVVLMLSWDWEAQKYKVRIDKQRNGIVGNLELKFKPQYSKFSDGEPFVPPMLPVKERKDWNA